MGTVFHGYHDVTETFTWQPENWKSSRIFGNADRESGVSHSQVADDGKYYEAWHIERESEACQICQENGRYVCEEDFAARWRASFLEKRKDREPVVLPRESTPQQKYDDAYDKFALGDDSALDDMLSYVSDSVTGPLYARQLAEASFERGRSAPSRGISRRFYVTIPVLVLAVYWLVLVLVSVS